MRNSILLTTVVAVVLGVVPAFAQPGPHHPRGKRREMLDRERRGPPAPQVTGYSPREGVAGTKVTITGTRLRRVAQVMFGPRAVTPDSATPRQLVFTVPGVERPGATPILLKHRGGAIEVGPFHVHLPGRGPAAHRAPPASSGPPPRGRHVRRWHRERVTVASYEPRMGRPGTRVTIRGENFTAELKVLYAGEEVKGVRIKPQRITFRIPKREGENVIALQAPGRREPLVVGPFDVNRTFNPAERRRQREVWRQRAAERWKKRQAELAQNEAERRRAMMEREAELQRTRVERRRQREAAIRARWEKAFLADPQVQAEMSLHAERGARLERMRRLAEVAKRGKLVIRIDVLVQRENTRHERRMVTLKANFKAE